MGGSDAARNAVIEPGLAFADARAHIAPRR